MSRPPLWQLPPGVASGTWEYTHSPHIASDYDRFLAGSSICRLDAQLIEQLFPPLASGETTLVADLGCGTGRSLIPLVQRGYHGLGIDLSQAMLQACRQRAAAAGVSVATLRANLAQLEGIAADSVDDAICLFSTLGMIRGEKNRQIALQHVTRILRPGGRFVVHAHNRWAAWSDPGGIAWLARSAWQAGVAGTTEFGDRVYPYRGLPDMFLHSFSRRELGGALRRAGLEVTAIFPLTRRADRWLPLPRCGGPLRAGGYIAIAIKPPRDR